jgi:hypothetical protein
MYNKARLGKGLKLGFHDSEYFYRGEIYEKVATLTMRTIIFHLYLRMDLNNNRIEV